MILLSAEKITKSYSEKKLIENCSLYVNEGDKIGIVGVNGTGKSTLLKIIAGIEGMDSGSITKTNGIKIGYLPQNPIFEENISVIDQVFKGASTELKELKEYEAKSILNKLGITDFDKDVRLLSGGQKKRVAIASALIIPCEILILDEPTNHIDNDMVMWLENYLINFKGAILMITHDRYFLDRVTNKIVEVDNHTLYSYEGNFSKFMELKAEREEMEASAERKKRTLFKKELEWIKRGPRARGTKSKHRIEQFEALSQRDIPKLKSNVELNSISSRLGKKTIEINNVSKKFNDVQIIKDFEYIVLRDDRVGIVGKNGCGKSTLLKMISGNLSPDSGEIILGDTVKLGYFSQEAEEMDQNLRVLEYIRSVAENIKTADGILTASQMLEKFLFPPELQWTSISKLSGGERRRLYLLRVLMDAPNILLLDEPTNDLDITTLFVLENFLESFNGAVIVVSHDRYFLDKVVDKIITFGDDGELKQCLGGYSEYLETMREAKKPNVVERKKESCNNDKSFERNKSRKLKFTFKEQKEYETINEDIFKLEQAIEENRKIMETEASNYLRLEELTLEKETLEQKLEEKMNRWVYLNELAQKIEDQKSL